MSAQVTSGAQGPGHIKGVDVPHGENPGVRMEIRTMVKDHPKMFNLYLLGLEEFQKVEEKKPLSYFQIAGIHGMPYVNWPDLKKGSGTPAGYCTHSSILFLTWHRPYLALFEAQLHQHVTNVANQFTEAQGKEQYLEAAKNFRMPYWDWALPNETGRAIVPEQVLNHDLKVVRPKVGQDSKVSNPLASYEFKDEGKNDKIINKFWNFSFNKTARHFNPSAGAPDDDRMQQQVEGFHKRDEWEDEEGNYYKKGKNLTERTLYLLQSYDSYAQMSYNMFYDSKKKYEFDNWGSLEDTHNVMHGSVGGGGHMGSIAISAFDPIFWLHHTNIDRLWAIWQVIHEDPQKPSTFVERYKNRRGEWQDKNTPLAPFHTPAGEYWTSETAKKTTTFGYVYPETQASKSRAQTIVDITRLYDAASVARTVQNLRQIDAQSVNTIEARAKSHMIVQKTSLNTAAIVNAEKPGALPELVREEAATIKLPADRSLEDLVSDNQYLEWLVNVKAKKHSLGGSYIVHFFLGDPEDDDPSLYVANPTHVAVFNTLGQDENTPCDSCQSGQAEGLQVTGQIPLTMALVERYLAGHVHGLTPEHVRPFLQRHLHWRVTALDGSRLRRQDVGKLLVSVVSNQVTIPDSPSELPRYADHVEVYPEITRNEGRARGRGTGYTGGSIAVA